MKKLFFLLLLLPMLVHGQARKYSNAFLNIGVDARAMAMSNSVIASSSDVGSGYWNPAGIAGVRDGWQAAAMHAEYFASIAQYDYLAFAQPLDENSSAAISLIRFGVDDILNTTELIDKNGNVDYDRISKFSAADYAVIGTYARNSAKIPNFSYGGSVKIIYRHIGDFASAVGFGFDVGARYQIGKWQFGGVVRDVTSTFNAWSINTGEFADVFERTGNQAPDNNLELTIPSMFLGVGRKFQINEDYSIHSEVNANITFGGQRNSLVSSSFANIDPGLGIEGSYNDFIFVRVGLGGFQRSVDFDNNSYYSFQPNLGLGFKYKGISIDYALTDIGNVSDVLYSNIFSLKFDIAGFRS